MVLVFKRPWMHARVPVYQSSRVDMSTRDIHKVQNSADYEHPSQLG